MDDRNVVAGRDTELFGDLAEDPLGDVGRDGVEIYLRRLLTEAREAEDVARAKRAAAQAASERIRGFRERLGQRRPRS